MKRKALDMFIAIVLGLVLMAPLGILCDAMNWGWFQTWGLAHGSFIIAWPLLALLSYGLIYLVRNRYVD